jgi:hypothetical protein
MMVYTLAAIYICYGDDWESCRTGPMSVAIVETMFPRNHPAFESDGRSL